MIHKRLDLIKKRHIIQSKEIRSLAKITLDQFLDAKMVMTIPLIHVTHETLEASVLECFKLFLQRLHIRCEGKLTAVIENQMICRVNALQVQNIRDGRAQRSEFRLVQ